MLYGMTWKALDGAGSGFASWVQAHGGLLALVAGLAAYAWRQSRRAGIAVVEQGREWRMREELQAYLALNVSPGPRPGAAAETADATRALARRVCRTIADKSVFSRVSLLLLRSPAGRLEVAGSVGTDDLTLTALEGWGAQLSENESKGRRLGPGGSNGAAPSFSIPLGEWNRFDPEVASWAASGRKERRRWRRGMITPVRTRGGRLLGAIAVCADGARLDGMSVAQGGIAPAEEAWNGKRPASLERALAPLEALAARLGAAIEADALAERLLRAEKLAGVGQLAAGVAHALNNPLTAVLGFADLIAESANEAHIRKDAGTILVEATKMQATVKRLVELSQPARLPDRELDLSSLLMEVADACESNLGDRGIVLAREGFGAAAPGVLGSPDRLREMLEHLLDNAAQAIASFRQSSGGTDETHTVRLTLLQERQAVRILVSDSGTGFADPARAFDPFYTTRGPEQGAGLGLSICYAIVREHRGEIHAFNQEPHGATVVLELPIWHTAGKENVLTEEDEATPEPPLARQSAKNDKISGIDTRGEIEEELATGSERWRSHDRRSGSR